MPKPQANDLALSDEEEVKHDFQSHGNENMYGGSAAGLVGNLAKQRLDASDNGMNASVISWHSISNNPSFTDQLQEELRTRLYLVRQALQKGQTDIDFLDIQNAFTNRTFETFFSIVLKVKPSFDKSQVEQMLMVKLKSDKSSDL